MKQNPINADRISYPQSVTQDRRWIYVNDKPTYPDRDGFLIHGGRLYIYDGHSTELRIPDGVETVASGAFRNNSILKSVTVPDTVTEIESEAFRD